MEDETPVVIPAHVRRESDGTSWLNLSFGGNHYAIRLAPADTYGRVMRWDPGSEQRA